MDGSGTTANATWKAVSTVEWKRKQRRPASASKGVGAILGEAADVVVGKWALAGPGGPGSPYLNRLSEIQVQDEAYIHQQLVKPDEVKPKRPVHRVLLAKGSRSGRGLKISLSRKVRFNEGDASPTHKAAAVAPAVGAGHSKDGVAAVAFASPATAAAAGAAQPGADSSNGGIKAGKGAGRHTGVRFIALESAVSNSSTTTSAQGNAAKSALQAAASQPHPSQSPVPVTSESTVMSGAAASSDTEAAGINCQPTAPPGQLQHQQQTKPVPLSHHARSSSSPHITAAGQQLSAGSSGGSTGSIKAAAARSSPSMLLAADDPIMSRFLQQQQQPAQAYGAPSSTGSVANSGALLLGALQPPVRPVSGPGAELASTRRKTTDLVDKQLQWLRDSTTSSSNSSSSGSSSSNGQPGHTAPSMLPSGPLADFTATFGYRPIAIPQELFDRWTNIGTAKPAAAAAAAPAANTPGPPAASAAAGGGGGPSGSPSGAAPTAVASTSTNNGDVQQRAAVAAVAPAHGPGSSLWQREQGVSSPPARRLSATSALEGRSEAALTGHRPPHRQATADPATLDRLVQHSRLSPAPPLRPLHQPSQPSAHSTAASQPPSGRASSPAADTSSGRTPSSSASSASSSSSSNPTRRAAGGSGGNTAGAGGTSSTSTSSSSNTWQLPCGSERRTRATGSSHEDDSGCGRNSPLRPSSTTALHSGGVRSPSRSPSPSAAAASMAVAGSSGLGLRRGSSRMLQEEVLSQHSSADPGQHQQWLAGSRAAGHYQLQQHHQQQQSSHPAISAAGGTNRLHLPTIGYKASSSQHPTGP